MAAINRVGFEPSPAGDGLEFWGASFVSDPFGVVLARGSHTEEELLVVPCDAAAWTTSAATGRSSATAGRMLTAIL